MGSENVIISSISRLPNKDYSVVKTLGPDPSSSTVDFCCVGGRFCQMKVARRLFLKWNFAAYYIKKRPAHLSHITSILPLTKRGNALQTLYHTVFPTTMLPRYLNLVMSIF